MVNASFISRLSQAVDQIEERLQQNRPLKVVTVRRGYHEDGNVAQARHFAEITLGEIRSSGGPTSPICCLFWGENDGLSILPET